MFQRLIGSSVGPSVFLGCMLLVSSVYAGAMAPPQPPQRNPHAPTTKKDKARVALAMAAVNRFLKSPLPKALATKKHHGSRRSSAGKSAACMNKTSCWSKDAAFVRQVAHFHHRYGRLVQARHAHIVPWSFRNFRKRANRKAVRDTPNRKRTMAQAKFAGPQLKKDEYMVHVYVRFGKPSGWYHLDVILAEDAKGRVSFRRFYTTPMRNRAHKLPPGVVC
jgi:hypothetical protein